MSVLKQYQFLKETEREQYFSKLLGFLHIISVLAQFEDYLQHKLNLLIS
jgi:hypothetical protein